MNSWTLPGQPWVITKGIAFVSFDLEWRKWIFKPDSEVYRKLPISFSLLSCIRQSNSLHQ